MSIEKIRNLIDQALVHLEPLEENEAERQKLLDARDGVFQSTARANEMEVVRLRETTKTVELGELVFLQSKLEVACQAVVAEVNRRLGK